MSSPSRLGAVTLLALSLLGCANAANLPQPAPPPDRRCNAEPAALSRRTLPLGVYSAPESAYARLAAHGFTLVGPYYGVQPSEGQLRQAATLGLGVLYSVQPEAPISSTPEAASPAAQVAGARQHEAVVGWYLLPEEVRPWDERELAAMQQTANTVRRKDDRGRRVFNYQPNNRAAADMRTLAAYVDVVARGAYPSYVGASDRRGWVRWSTMEVVRATAEHGTPWVVLEMFQQPEPKDMPSIARWARHDTYASLVAGAQGLLVFSGWARPGFSAYDAYLAAYLEVAQELNGAPGLAAPLLLGADRPSRVRVLDGVATASVSAPFVEVAFPSVVARRVEHGGFIYTYVVSSAETDTRVQIDPVTDCPSISLTGPSLDADHTIRLGPLGVSVLRSALAPEL